MADLQPLSPAAKADIAAEALYHAIAQHGLMGTLTDLVDNALTSFYDWGRDEGYRQHHIASHNTQEPPA